MPQLGKIAAAAAWPMPDPGQVMPAISADTMVLPRIPEPDQAAA
jgi:hypothetical protein